MDFRQEISSIFGGESLIPLNINYFFSLNPDSRFNQIDTFWNAYSGKYFQQVREDGALPYANICHAAVEKTATWLCAKTPKFKTLEENQTIISQIYDEVIENSGSDIFYRSAQIGGITGDAILQAVYDPTSSYGKGGVAIRVLDTDKVFLEYTNQRNNKVLTRVLIYWNELDPSTGAITRMLELWDKDFVTVYAGSTFSLGITFSDSNLSYTQFNQGGIKYTKIENPYKMLPFVHIKNLKVGNSIFGRSDLHDLYSINKEINQALVSYKDNVDYHNFPITLVYGISMNDVHKSPGKIWSNLNPAGRIENLEVTQTYDQIKEYITLLEKYQGLASIPMRLYSVDQAVQTDTSYASLRLAFLPLVELVDRKKLSYGEGFKKIMELCLQVYNKEKSLNLEKLNKTPDYFQDKLEEAENIDKSLYDKLSAIRMMPYYYTTVVFEDYLPRNRTLELADIEIELRNKLESVQGAMSRLGITDIEEKKEEINEDTEEGFMTATPPPFDPNSSGQPDSTGGEGSSGESSDYENAGVVEEDTGQSAERTIAQRAAKGKQGL